MSSAPIGLEPQPGTSTTPAIDAARMRLLAGSDYLGSFPLDLSAARRDRPASMKRDARTTFHALRGAVPK